MGEIPIGTVLRYDGGQPRQDKDGNIIPEAMGSGCLVYPILLFLIIGSAWYAISNWI